MKAISWIASYPKSGNTWFRAFLTALIGKNIEGTILEKLEGGPIASSKEIFELEAGVGSGDLTHREIQSIRPDVFRSYAKQTSQRLYLKIHDSRIDPEFDLQLIPADVTQNAVYLVRNPLDIAGSWANHTGIDIEKATRSLLDDSHKLANDKSPKYKDQLQQFLGNWSFHVQSWTEQTEFPTLTIKYEDLLEAPDCHFKRASQFLELENSETEIERAIDASRFKKLQKWENQHGFKEKPHKSKQFFRKGTSGSWREELPPSCVERIVDKHQATMQRFGYVDKQGNPV